MFDKHTRQQICASNKSKADRTPVWLVFLAYLAYLQAIRPNTSAEVEVFRLIIVMAGVVIAILALAATGAPELIIDVLKLWLLG